MEPMSFIVIPQQYTTCKISAQKLYFQSIDNLVKLPSIIEAKYETFGPLVGFLFLKIWQNGYTSICSFFK